MASFHNVCDRAARVCGLWCGEMGDAGGRRAAGVRGGRADGGDKCGQRRQQWRQQRSLPPPIIPRPPTPHPLHPHPTPPINQYTEQRLPLAYYSVSLCWFDSVLSTATPAPLLKPTTSPTAPGSTCRHWHAFATPFPNPLPLHGLLGATHHCCRMRSV